MELFAEILKYTLPALIVFATAYFLIKQLFDQQSALHAQKLRLDAKKITLPVRFQAYERLSLLCERISLPNVLLRIRTQGMKVADLKLALMVAVSQEFDHNVSQQIYVSDTLWQIIRFAQQDVLNGIAQVAAELDHDAPDQILVDALFAYLDQKPSDPLIQAQTAIRTEIGQLFG